METKNRQSWFRPEINKKELCGKIERERERELRGIRPTSHKARERGLKLSSRDRWGDRTDDVVMHHK